jgi:molybdopterin molybdotransferase
MKTDLLPFDAALALLLETPMAAYSEETVPLSAAQGRVLAKPVISSTALPAFDNSSVDGYALCGEAVEVLPIVGTSAAGMPWEGTLQPGQAVRILTGAAVPAGADRIAMQEVCHCAGDRLTVSEWPASGACIRRTGQDLAAGAQVLMAGKRLGFPEIGMLAALGSDTVTVRRKPKIVLFSTGSELSDSATLQPGQIRDANRPLLQALLAAWPVEVEDGRVLPDDPECTRDRLLGAAQRADLIITSGGVSVGDHDYIRELVEREGQEIFWRLALRPGKPLLFGTIGGTPLLGLPGNPVSSAVTFHLAARPLLYRLLGMDYKPPLHIPVSAGFTYTKPANLREFIRVTVARDGRNLVAVPFRSQMSNLISSLLESDGLLDLPAGLVSVEAGQAFDFLPWSGFTIG